MDKTITFSFLNTLRERMSIVPKRDDGHPRPFCMGVAPIGCFLSAILYLNCLLASSIVEKVVSARFSSFRPYSGFDCTPIVPVLRKV